MSVEPEIPLESSICIQSPSDSQIELEQLLQREIESAVFSARRDVRTYESLRNLGEVIGAQYGNRVLYELVQNAHDAHRPGELGAISIDLRVHSDSEGELLVANKGRGFSIEDVKSIRNLATSRKEIGESIGNKGLGFRSVETLTDDVRIFSQRRAEQKERFDGFCFRFASPRELRERLNGVKDAPGELLDRVVEEMPRYLASVPIEEQSNKIRAYAREGYATVVVLPLRTPQAIELATSQVRLLSDSTAPLLLFLDRIEEVRIAIEREEQDAETWILRRSQRDLGRADSLANCTIHRVNLGKAGEYLVVRRILELDSVLQAVAASVEAAPPLKRWLEWKGSPTVSIAVPWDRFDHSPGRLYNFLPMGENSPAPLGGHIDAPFFADIDRRSAKAELPLNAYFMQAAAEACSGAVLFATRASADLPLRSLFDLITWDPPCMHVRNAFRSLGSDLSSAKVLPALSIGRAHKWVALSELVRWPEGKFETFAPRRLVAETDASVLLPELGSGRIKRLESIAMAVTGRDLLPDGGKLSDWAQAIAKRLHATKARPRKWGEFYDELRGVFQAARADLTRLSGKEAFLERSGKLKSSVVEPVSQRRVIYVRPVDRGSRSRLSGVPLPPHSISRRFLFLDERIPLSTDTLLAFEKAKLLRRYDPIEALTGIDDALGERTSDRTRQEAMVWAFKAWRTEQASVEKVLKNSRLRVPTVSGWKQAKEAYYSSSWTSAGRRIETYFTEAAMISEDCANSRNCLLISFSEWPKAGHDTTRQQWIGFLTALGVRDIIRPIAGTIGKNGLPAYLWNDFLARGSASLGLDQDWCNQVKHLTFNYPYTQYCDHGEVWRLPGQLELEKLSPQARNDLCLLAISYLHVAEEKHWSFQIGRFDRHQPYQDSKTAPTPLAVFFKVKPWVSLLSEGSELFRAPAESWGTTTRRIHVPRFVPRLPNPVVDELADAKFADIVFGPKVGMRDWASKDTAVERLHDLANAFARLTFQDRKEFRDEYRRAWADVCSTGQSLPPDLPIVVRWNGENAIAQSTIDAPTDVILASDARDLSASLISASGRRVLEIGGADAVIVARLLAQSGAWLPAESGDLKVEILVDRIPFEPRESDPKLVSQGLEWLPDFAVICNEIIGSGFERNIARSTIEERIRAIRIRYCDSYSLAIGGHQADAGDNNTCYAFPHEIRPTLIVVGRSPLTWSKFLNLIRVLPRLVDSRLQSLEIALMRLRTGRIDDALTAPEPAELAAALGRDLSTIEEHLSALRCDSGRIFRLATVLVAYWAGVEAAKQLRHEADREGTKFDFRGCLTRTLPADVPSAAEIVSACEEAADMADLRRKFGLDYAMFNDCLSALDEPVLNNEAGLRQFFEATLKEAKPTILNRLRRRYFSDYREGRPLIDYVELKALSFIEFDTRWIATRETLDRDTVLAHVGPLLDASLGPDRDVKLADLDKTVDENRRTLQRAAQAAVATVFAWSRRNSIDAPPSWRSGDPQAVVRTIESTGLIDFDFVTIDDLPGLCVRAECWPGGMPATTDAVALGLTQANLASERDRVTDERAQLERERRTVRVGGHDLDTGAIDFEQALREVIERSMLEGDRWYRRSRRRVSLKEFDEANEKERGSGSGGPRSGRRRTQPSEAVRDTMGLVSERIAFQYLKIRHKGYTDEESWVSRNRAKFCGGAEGDDTLGYDFQIKTPNVEWLYEVKSALDVGGEFELTANEMLVASSLAKDGRRRYRILYIPFAFDPEECRVLELPNPMGEKSRSLFKTIGRGSVRMRFEREG